MPYNNYPGSSTNTQPEFNVAAGSEINRDRDMSIQPSVDSSGNPVFNPTINDAGHIVSPGSTGQQATNVFTPNMQPTGQVSTNGAPVNSTPSAAGQTTAPTQQAGYSNPTAVPQSTKTFGQENSDQFMIDPFMQPFEFEQQKSENDQYLSGFTEAINAQETLPAIQQRYENRYGVRDLQENYLRTKEMMEDVGNDIKGLNENVLSRTKNSNVSQAQVDRMRTSEAKEMMQTYSDLGELNERQGRRLAIAEQNLNEAAKLEMAQQQKELTPWLQKYDLMKVMQAREFSGWTFASQLELNRLVSNQNAGLTWTNAETQRAHELSVLEKQFQNQLTLLEKQNEFALDLWA